MKREKAFTLAEVLITLAIIGVVAALTIPTVVHNYRKKQLEVSLKKAHSVINNTVNLMRMDLGYNLTRKMPVRTFATRFMKYFSVVKYCGLADCFSAAKPRYRNFNNTANLYYAPFDDGNFVTKDGMTMFIENEGNNLFVSADVNGHNKGPNRAGIDLFTFYFDDFGKFKPMGCPGSTYARAIHCSLEDTNDRNGIGCTYRALTDKSYWDNVKY